MIRRCDLARRFRRRTAGMEFLASDPPLTRSTAPGDLNEQWGGAYFVAPGPAVGLLPSVTLTMPTWKIVPLLLTTSDENRPPALRQSMHHATKTSGARLGKACRAALCRSARSCPTVPGAALVVAMPKAPRHAVSALLGEPAQPATLSRPTMHNATARSRTRSSARKGEHPRIVDLPWIPPIQETFASCRVP